MSAFIATADLQCISRHVREVPKADIILVEGERLPFAGAGLRRYATRSFLVLGA